MKAEELAQQLKKKTELTPQQIREKTNDKMEEYKGLLTNKESAVILVGKEHDIDLVDLNRPELEIQNIDPDMQEVTIKAKVKEKDQFSYTKDGEQKKACDVTLYDDSGEISLMLWGDQIQEVSEISAGEVVELSGAYSNKYQGDVQLGWSSNTSIEVKE